MGKRVAANANMCMCKPLHNLHNRKLHGKRTKSIVTRQAVTGQGPESPVLAITYTVDAVKTQRAKNNRHPTLSRPARERFGAALCTTAWKCAPPDR